ncbi:MAG: SPOR domain-containing protein [Muribaculaceae bacterium]|nr:SPOR domain-containing protein [Muribaculaceae bacterium]
MKYKILRLIAPFMVLILFAGCKTTEKNYKAAYDVAIQKKKEASSEEEIGIGAGILQEVDGPAKREIGDATIYFERHKIKRVDTSEVLRGRYCVVVGAYKMKTNCSAQVRDMEAKGYPAFMAQDGDGMYYVVIGVCPTIEEAAQLSAEYVKKEKPQSYVGFANGPVVFLS